MSTEQEKNIEIAMVDTIVGMMWNKNEGDILEEVIENALSKVDTLFIADDHSTDSSWDIIQSFGSRVEYMWNKRDNPNDPAQRQHLLNEIRRRYKPENTWVQVIESDIMILDTDVKEAVKRYASKDIMMSWHCLNAVRDDWTDHDTWPHWDTPITEVLPSCHWMEVMTYTFRPLPRVNYNQRSWRPWPQGFSYYAFGEPLYYQQDETMESFRARVQESMEANTRMACEHLKQYDYTAV